MDKAERKENFASWLRRAWNAAIRTAEAMERSPVEELFDRIDRLEWEVTALKEGAPGIHAAIGEMADVERA